VTKVWDTTEQQEVEPERGVARGGTWLLKFFSCFRYTEGRFQTTVRTLGYRVGPLEQIKMEEAEQRGGTLGHIFTRTALLLSFVKFDF
jgi:hypothetical protein